MPRSLICYVLRGGPLNKPTFRIGGKNVTPTRKIGSKGRKKKVDRVSVENVALGD